MPAHLASREDVMRVIIAVLSSLVVGISSGLALLAVLAIALSLLL
jgi:hypothetical protein